MTNNQRPWSPPQITWSSLATAFVVIAVGFSWFGIPGLGWVTHSGANRMAQSAVVEQLVPICVAQARRASAEDLAVFQATKVWDRRELVEAKGWATMPGSSSPDSAIAQPCSEALYALQG